MKRSIFSTMLLCICLFANAQATDLVIDCQTPGWLSSKINYGDQKTVRNLKVTGYVNYLDLKFIGTLVNYQNLDGMVDLSECDIVRASTGGIDNGFGGLQLEKNDTIRSFRIPKSATLVTRCTNRLYCDTIYFDCTLKYVKQECLDESTTDIGCLFLGEGIDSIPDNAFNNCKIGNLKGGKSIRYIGSHAFFNIPFRDFPFSENLRYVGNNAFNGHHMNNIILPDSMDFLGAGAFASDYVQYVQLPTKLCEWGVQVFGNYCPDTIRVPYGIKRYDCEAIKYKRGQTWYFPESVKYIKGELLCLTGRDSWEPSRASIYLESQDVVEVSKLSITSTISIDDAIESARKYRSGWTVYVPKGMIEDYKNSQYWYNTHTGSSYGHNVYYADCYWCHATFKEIIIPVTGIELDCDYFEFSEVGERKDLKATIIPFNADNKTVKWKSTNEAVCIVAQGNIIAVGYGTTVIIATTEDGGFMDYCTVTVEDNTAVRGVKDDAKDDEPAYDASGRKVKDAKKGQIVIKQGKKYIAQ